MIDDPDKYARPPVRYGLLATLFLVLWVYSMQW